MSFRLIKTEKSNNIFNIILNDEKHQNTLSEEMINELSEVFEMAESDNEITIFPNPSTGAFRVMTNIENYSFKIFDSFGKRILSKQNLSMIQLM